VSFNSVAQNMAKRGVHVVPTYQGLRYPALAGWQDLATTDPAVINKWSSNGYSTFNCVSVAKRTNPDNTPATFFLDIDNLAAAKELGMPELPNTLSANTPSGGLHVYFKHSRISQVLDNCSVKVGEEKVVEVKAHNAAVCSPGCTRDDGGTYTIRNDAPIIPIPSEWVLWLVTKASTARPTPSRPGKRRKFHPDFDRDDLFEHYEWEFASEFNKDGADFYVFDSCPIKGEPHDDQVRSKKTCLIIGNTIGFDCKVCDEYGWKELVEFMEEEHGIEKFPGYIYADEDDNLLFENTDLVDVDTPEQPKSVEEVMAFLGATRVSAAAPSDETIPDVDTSGFSYRKSDTGNAERLVRRFGARIRYVGNQGMWRVWNGTCWEEDQKNMLDRASKRVAKELFEEALDLEEEERKKMLQWAITSESRDRRSAMIDLAAKERAVISLIKEYDRDPWLFNVQNGTIDLKTQTLRSHRPEDMMTKMSPVNYDANASCPRFDKFILEAMNGDQELVNFLARAAGYSLSGDTSIQAMFFNHGEGENGKGVLVETLAYIIGDYAQPANFDTFVHHKKAGREIRNDLASLVGVRFLSAEESGEDHRLDESLIKSLTGENAVRTRFLYQEEFTYYPNFKIWMSSNFRPSIRSTDWGTWRRVKLIPWEVVVPKERRDEQLKAKLRTEASGILNWMLHGLADYLKNGMQYPPKVEAATSQYRESQDVIAQFIAAKCVLDVNAEVRFSELYSAYKDWADAAREYMMPARKFSDALKKRDGVQARGKMDGTWYTGIALIASALRSQDILEDDI
jgi:putative DNA primase/helicase